MLAYYCEYDSGEIKVDEKEIIAADWYGYDNKSSQNSTRDNTLRTSLFVLISRSFKALVGGFFFSFLVLSISIIPGDFFLVFILSELFDLDFVFFIAPLDDLLSTTALFVFFHHLLLFY